MHARERHPDIIPFPTEQRRASAVPAQPVHIGLLAGAGEFPVRFAKAARRAGHSVFGLGVTSGVSENLSAACDQYRYAPLWRIGRAIRVLHRTGVRRLVMAGRVEQSVLFHPFRWLRLLPDYRSLKMWVRFLRQRARGTTLLHSVVREFERDGFQFDSALDYAPELIVKHGFLTSRKPSAAQWQDIQFGWQIASEMGRLDVGQTVIVNDGAVIAVEAIEGMDHCIRRAGELSPRGGFTVVRVPRPNSDRRFHVPTIGLDTIKVMHQAGARVLAMEAEQTIVIEPSEVTQLADTFGIAIVAVNAREIGQKAAA